MNGSMGHLLTVLIIQEGKSGGKCGIAEAHDRVLARIFANHPPESPVLSMVFKKKIKKTLSVT